MLRGVIIWFLVEICLLSGGIMFFPDWMSANAEILFVFSFGLLLAFLCYENWPHWMQALERSRWSSIDDAAPLFRDSIDRHNLDALGGWHDVAVTEMGAEDASATFFMSYLRDGINDGQIVAYGVPDHGKSSRRIPAPVDDSMDGFSLSKERKILGSDGRKYHSVTIKKSSIEGYIRYLKDRHG